MSVDFLSTGSICKDVYSTLVIADLLYCKFFLYSLINNIKKNSKKNPMAFCVLHKSTVKSSGSFFFLNLDVELLFLDTIGRFMKLLP